MIMDKRCNIIFIFKYKIYLECFIFINCTTRIINMISIQIVISQYRQFFQFIDHMILWNVEDIVL